MDEIIINVGICPGISTNLFRCESKNGNLICIQFRLESEKTLTVISQGKRKIYLHCTEVRFELTNFDVTTVNYIAIGGVVVNKSKITEFHTNTQQILDTVLLSDNKSLIHRTATDKYTSVRPFPRSFYTCAPPMKSTNTSLIIPRIYATYLKLTWPYCYFWITFRLRNNLNHDSQSQIEHQLKREEF